jgi:hypothetical protein
MAKEICIKTPSGMLCSASPITDCSCDRNIDPYPEAPPPEKLDNPKALAAAILSAISKDERGSLRDGVSLEGKGAAVLTTVKLMLMKQVAANQAFVVLGLDGMDGHGEAK